MSVAGKQLRHTRECGYPFLDIGYRDMDTRQLPSAGSGQAKPHFWYDGGCLLCLQLIRIMQDAIIEEHIADAGIQQTTLDAYLL